jgi:hypothetical protein
MSVETKRPAGQKSVETKRPETKHPFWPIIYQLTLPVAIFFLHCQDRKG